MSKQIGAILYFTDLEGKISLAVKSGITNLRSPGARIASVYDMSRSKLSLYGFQIVAADCDAEDLEFD